MAESPDRSRPPAVAAAEVALPAFDRAPLDAGLELVALRAPGPPMARIELVLPAGGALDPPGAAGLADLTARLLPEGAGARDRIQIAERVEALGARLSVGSGHDAAWIRLTVLRSGVEGALELLGDLALRPTFPEAEVERVLAERAIDLRRELDDPAAVAGRAFVEELFGIDHPYGQPRRGTVESLARLDRDAFVEFHGRVWRPRGATLIVVGDFDPDELRAGAETALGGAMGEGVPTADVAAPERPGSGTVLVDRPGSAQSVLVCGHVGVPRAHPDYHALETLNHLLGGSFTSRLNQNLRERRGWTYGVRSSFSFRRGPGPFQVATQVETAVSPAALAEIRGELERAAAGPIGEEERALAVHGLTRSLPLRFETGGQLAGRLREIVIYGLPDDWWTGYAERVEALSVGDLERAAAEHLHPDRLLSVVVGDAATVADGLAEAGPVRRRPWKPDPASAEPAS